MKKRFLSLLLVSTMLIGIVPFSMVTASAADDLIWPCESTYYITCMYYYKTGGQHSTKYGYKTSMDIAGGGNIVAVEDGVVEVATDLGNTSFGKYVIIKHPSGYRSLYAHLASYSVSAGQQVTQGQRIGVMGTTGNSSGVHLHFEYSGGDPWKDFYNAKYMDKISFEQNVRSNNAAYNSDKTIVNVIDNYYYKSGTNYYFNHSHAYTNSGYESAHPHKMYKACACGAKQYTGEEYTSASCTQCAFAEAGIAINADYTISGCGTGYGQYTADLTDGVYAQNLSFDNNWFAFYYNQGAASNVVNAPNGVGSVTIDLGKYYKLSQVKMHMINDSGSGITAPKAINIYYSVDGTNFSKATSVGNISNTDKLSYVCSADLTQTARYVKVEFELSGTYAFVNEIKVFGTETTYTPEPDDDTSDDTSDDDIAGNNVALGKDYEGGEVSPVGSYSANLTDGQANTEGKFDSTWYAFYYHKDATSDKITAPDGIGTIIIDLEDVVDGITDVKVHVWNCNASGILPAKGITLFVSEDGNTYTEVGELDIPNGDAPAWATISTDNISARYVKLVVETQAVWTFLNEIEVYADPNYVPDDDTSDGDTSDGDDTSDDDATDGKLGDVDVDGDVDAADYILVKRAVLKNFTLSEEQEVIADIDEDGDVDAADYVLVKRIVLGTYTAQ